MPKNKFKRNVFGTTRGAPLGEEDVRLCRGTVACSPSAYTRPQECPKLLLGTRPESTFVPRQRQRNPDKDWISYGLSGPVSRDTARLSQRYPPIARYGVFGVSTWPIGCDTLSPFSERFPLGEHAKWRCDTPPQEGYLSDTCATPYENKANGCDTPLCDTISKRYCAIWGGISHWASKVMGLACTKRKTGAHSEMYTSIEAVPPPSVP